jgi:diguanylate cyclase (GGDEF)-like protein
VWIEAVARTMPSVDDPDAVDIIYSGRDVSLRIAAEQALLASQRELEALARVDSLTGLPNRRQFDERLSLAVARSRRPGLPIALLYLDIDHFKQINDTHGHGVGDQVLRVFAARLARCVRAGDLVARLGGDEFVVLVEDALLPQAAEFIARKLIATMDMEFITVKVIAMVGSSIWICGSGAGVSGCVMVSPMPMPSTPAMARIAPGGATVSSTRFSPSSWRPCRLAPGSGGARSFSLLWASPAAPPLARSPSADATAPVPCRAPPPRSRAAGGCWGNSRAPLSRIQTARSRDRPVAGRSRSREDGCALCRPGTSASDGSLLAPPSVRSPAAFCA